MLLIKKNVGLLALRCLTLSIYQIRQPHSNLTRTRLANDAGDKIELRCGNRIEGRVVKTSEWECAPQVGMEEGSAGDESDGRIAPHLADFESWGTQLNRSVSQSSWTQSARAEVGVAASAITSYESQISQSLSNGGVSADS